MFQLQAALPQLQATAPPFTGPLTSNSVKSVRGKLPYDRPFPGTHTTKHLLTPERKCMRDESNEHMITHVLFVEAILLGLLLEIWVRGYTECTECLYGIKTFYHRKVHPNLGVSPCKLKTWDSLQQLQAAW